MITEALTGYNHTIALSNFITKLATSGLSHTKTLDFSLTKGHKADASNRPFARKLVVNFACIVYTAKDEQPVYRVVENSIEQCCAAHIVECFQQYCSALLSLN